MVPCIFKTFSKYSFCPVHVKIGLCTETNEFNFF